MELGLIDRNFDGNKTKAKAKEEKQLDKGQQQAKKAREDLAKTPEGRALLAQLDKNKGKKQPLGQFIQAQSKIMKPALMKEVKKAVKAGDITRSEERRVGKECKYR